MFHLFTWFLFLCDYRLEKKMSQANEVTSESSLRSLGLYKHWTVSKDRVPSELFLPLALAFGCALTTLYCFLPLSAMCNGSFRLFYHHHLQFNPVKPTTLSRVHIYLPCYFPLLLSPYYSALSFGSWVSFSIALCFSNWSHWFFPSNYT